MTCARMECKMRGSCAYECDKSDGAPDVVDKFMMMAERAFKQRDELAGALRNLLRFCEEATEYEMQHPADYSAYLDAKASLGRVGGATK